jgi:hypothetical protein
MPTVTLTLTDTPHGGVAIHSTYIPAVGNPCSPAQDAALEILKRTHKQWGVNPAMQGVDIDAVHAINPHIVAVAKRLHHANPGMTMTQCMRYALAEMGDA